MADSIAFPLGQLPQEIITEIGDMIDHYMAILVILDSDNKPTGVASGTLVSIRGRLAILTAQHVVDVIRQGHLGLGLSLDTRSHKFLLEPESLLNAGSPKPTQQKWNLTTEENKKPLSRLETVPDLRHYGAGIKKGHVTGTSRLTRKRSQCAQE